MGPVGGGSARDGGTVMGEEGPCTEAKGSRMMSDRRFFGVGHAVDAAFHGVAQFADVTGPVVAQERVRGLLGEAGEILALQLGGHFLREVVGEDGDVLAAGAQRRDCYDVEGEAVEQVGAEFAGGGEVGEVDVGGGDDADVDLQGFAAADAFELAVLYDAQQLFLHGLAGGGDFVEEDGAAVGELEAAWAAALGAGEGAGFMAEQFGVQQGVGQGGAVQFYERAIPAGGEVGHAAGDKFLAGATLANHQDRAVQRGRLGDVSQHVQKRRGLADRGFGVGGVCNARHMFVRLASLWRRKHRRARWAAARVRFS